MQVKKKICAGWDGVEHEQYIYKNINGKKYCFLCTCKLEPRKEIKKVSDKQKFKITLKKDLHAQDKIFYEGIWERRFGEIIRLGVSPTCECCNKVLSIIPNLMYFHHILEKKNYPEHRHEGWNIAIVCPDCHSSYETNPDNQPALRDKKKSIMHILDGMRR